MRLLVVGLCFFPLACHTLAQPDGTTGPGSVTLLESLSETFSIVKLEVALETTSDWASLRFENDEGILAVRVLDSDRRDPRVLLQSDRFVIAQDIDAASGGSRVGVRMHIAVKSGLPAIRVILSRGDLGQSRLRVRPVGTDNREQLTHVFIHDLVSPGPNNRAAYSIPLNDYSVEEEVEVRKLSSPRIALAFYYSWYSMETWADSRLDDRPLEPYDSRSRSVIRHHVSQASDAGLDGFVWSWFGKRSQSDVTLSRLLEEIKGSNFVVAAYLETIWKGEPLAANDLYDRISYIVHTHGHHPNYLKVNGRPVILLYATQKVGVDTWKDVLDRVSQQGMRPFYVAMGYDLQNLELFDGIHAYSVHRADLSRLPVVAKLVRQYTLLNDAVSPKLWVATIQPGHDSRRFRKTGTLVERAGGSFYRTTFDRAIASKPDWMLVTSWNEWWEHTHIEPSVRHSKTYLNWTREFLKEWRASTDVR